MQHLALKAILVFSSIFIVSILYYTRDYLFQQQFPFENMLVEIVENNDTNRLPIYFNPDAIWILHGRELSYQEFLKRMQWMNERKHKVHFQEAIVSGNRAAMIHETEFIDEDGNLSRFRVFSRISLKSGRISRFEHMTRRVEGNAPTEVVSSY